MTIGARPVPPAGSVPPPPPGGDPVPVAAADAPPAAPGPGRSGHRARWIAVGTLVITAGLVAVLATRPSATVAALQSPLVGHQAPPVSGVTVDGGSFVLPRAPGRFIVLNFFASWCTPCQEEGPELVKFEFEHQASGTASVVSVVFSDTVSAARAYQQTLGATWPTLADPGGTLALNYGVSHPPSTYLIAPDGRLVAYLTGPVTASGLNRLIAAAQASHA